MRKLETRESVARLDADTLVLLRQMQAKGREMARAGEVARKLSVNSVQALGAMERVKDEL